MPDPEAAARQSLSPRSLLQSPPPERAAAAAAGKRSAAKKCCLITSAVVLVIVLVLVILFLTVFKPRKPETVTSIKAPTFSISLNSFNLSFDATITIKNRNYASFKYDNTTAYIYYYDEEVGEAPVGANDIHSRSTSNISTVVDVEANKVTSSQHFVSDVKNGVMPFTGKSNIRGKVVIIGIIKIHAKIYVSCDITVFITNTTVGYSCTSTVSI